MYKGRLGNNLFQYVVANLLSIKHNLKIVAKKPDFYLIDNQIKSSDEKKSSNKKSKKKLLITDNNFLKILDMNNLNCCDLIINGYFQKKEFVKKYKNEILACFNMENEKIDGTFVHYRLGDLQDKHWHPNAVVHLNYYRKALNRINNKNNNCYISSDSPEHEFVKTLQKEFNLKTFTGSPKETIAFASKFDHKVLSFGSFSWWIGFLGNQSDIIYGTGIDENGVPYEKWSGDDFVFENWSCV